MLDHRLLDSRLLTGHTNALYHNHQILYIMVKKILSLLFKTGKKATESTGKSMEFIDDLLEKEYIGTAVDNLKTSSGKIVETAGLVYQKTVDKIDENVNLDKIREAGDKLIEKSKETTEKLSETMEESTDTMKSVFKEGERIVKDVLGEDNAGEEE